MGMLTRWLKDQARLAMADAMRPDRADVNVVENAAPLVAQPIASILPGDKVGEIVIRGIREDRPKFARTYTASVGDGFKVIVTMKTYTFGRSDWSELRQSDNRYIVFDAKRVADKIIDRELYPLVQAAVNKILEMDKQFLATHPDEYTDDTGAQWRRVLNDQANDLVHRPAARVLEA